MTITANPAVDTDEAYLDKESIAIHEAGHAVVATITGITVRYATLAPRDGGGMVVLRPRRTGFPARESIAISCAGMIAQDVAGEERWFIVEESDPGDVANIRDDARRWHAASEGVTVLDLITQAWEVAYDLIVNHYGAVLAVAERLMTSRTALTGPEIRTCIDTAPAESPSSLTPGGRTFWVPEYSSLRNWGPSPSKPRARRSIHA